MKIKATVRDFISKYLKADAIDDDTNLFQTGTVNSLFSIQLINFLEKEFDISIENEDIVLENFSSINKIDAFIVSKKEKQSQIEDDCLS